MTVDMNSIGKTSINEASLTGTDCRYEQAFEDLQAEVDKIGSPSASEGINWQRVSTLSEGILTNESKDLLVASYYTVSLIHTENISGLTASIQVYRDLLETFWDTMFPKKKRMRGRIAAVEWWVEYSTSALESLALQAVEESQKKSLLEDCERLNQLLLNLFPEPISIKPLTRVIETLSILRDMEKTEEVVTKKEETEAPLKETPVPPPEPIVQHSLVSSDEAIKGILSSNEHIRRAAIALVEHDLPNPLGHRALRTAIWAVLDSLPHAVENKTIIPPPEPHIVTALQGLSSRGDWINLSTTAEKQFPEYIFWIDLHRYCATGLENLGPPYAKALEAVSQETASLIHRLPGILSLQFSDGSPFANEETLEWCQNISSGGSSMDITSGFSTMDGDTDEANQLNTAIQQAGQFLREKKLTDAINLLQKGLQEAHSAKESMQWRLALVQILIGGKKAEIALPHCELLTEELTYYNLESWDPNQALIVYKTFYHCLKSISSRIVKERGGELLGKIARLNSAEAIRISS